MISKIIDLLKQNKYTISELSKLLDISEKQVVYYIERIIFISKKKDWELIIYPAICKKCGYIFKENLHPSKCPKCKSEWIKEAIFEIREQ